MMDSFHIPLPPEKKTSFDFDPEDFSGISCPGSALDEGSPEEADDDIELPLPPGTSDEFLFPPPLKEEENLILSSSNLKNDPDGFEEFGNDKDFQLEGDENVKNVQEDVASKANEFLDDNKYSPSKVDSDDDNQDFASSKPKVLGKEQAKKRLMAFSLSKQPNVSVKKNKTPTAIKNKEKPPNPNKGSNVQDQFRATISAIEEEKKKMFQNMPSYLLMEMSELTSSHSSMSSSAQLLEKLKKESMESKNSKEESSKRRGEESKRRSRRSRSRSRSKKRRRSGSRSKRSRSRSRNKSSPRRRRRSHSKSRRSRSRSKKREEKNKVSKESQSTPKPKFEDWKSFKASGLILENLNKPEEKSKPNFKPYCNYLNKSELSILQAKPVDPKNNSPVLFSEKIIKYTRTKPILCWSENPSLATDYYMLTKTLLENCDEATSVIVLSIIENKNLQSFGKDGLDVRPNIRLWYPRYDYLLPVSSDGNDLSVENAQEATKKVIKERKISLVNDSYLSDEEDPVKDTDVSSVNLKSKWDSDREESAEKEPVSHQKTKEETKTKIDIFEDDFDIPPCHEKQPSPKTNPESPKKQGATETLVSEYEEFLKMVAVDSNDKSENQKVKSPKIEATDWDQESDREGTSSDKKTQFSESIDEFSILGKNEVEYGSIKKINKKVSKKTEKSKTGKKKAQKKVSKGKKKKEYSDNSSSESYQSDSDSDSDSDRSVDRKKKKKKNKKKKVSKTKKSRKDSSSESESDSKKKKKKAKKKKKRKDSSSEESDEGQNSLLKQLDFKKQIIMKKIEQIDCISDKNIKKKEKDTKKRDSSKVKKKERDDVKHEKKKSSSDKSKKTTKSDTSSGSDSESSDESTKKKKSKAQRKRSYSGSDNEKKSQKSKSSKKLSKKRKKHKSDTETSDSSGSDSSREKKKSKRKVESPDKTDDLLGGSKEVWEDKKLWKKGEGKTKTKKGWEGSSTSEESIRENKARESSWDEEVTGTRITEELTKTTTGGNELKENTSLNIDTKSASETLKTSMSNFSFNENSFCSFGQELSRDFFLTERSFSNSGVFSCNDTSKSTLIEPRPFKSVSKDTEIKKPPESELYSPGCSDSDLSEAEVPTKPEEGKVAVAQTDVYDPLNCDSENSVDNLELSNIPLPHNIEKNSENVLKPSEPEKVLKTPPKTSFTIGDFTSVATPQTPSKEEKITPTKRQLMSVKGQQKLISKAAAVFQDESDEENIEPASKNKTEENQENKADDEKKSKKEKDRHRDRSSERRKRSRSREKSRSDRKKSLSPGRNRRRSKTPEVAREKREIRSDSFEIEPLKSAFESADIDEIVQPIPVLTSVEKSTEGLWSRSLMPTTDFSNSSTNRIDHPESFDIYPSEESNYRNRNYEFDQSRGSSEKSRDGKSKKDRKKSRSRSYSPRKKYRSKSPERRKSPRGRSPRRKSVSPKRRDKSPLSPRRKSPKRKSPSRRYRSSRSPDKRRKSHSRSPRRRRGSPRRSRSPSPKKYRSPKHRGEKETARSNHTSPRKDSYYSDLYPEGLQNRIPVIGASNDDGDLSPSAIRKNYSQHIPDEPEFYNSFYDGEYTDEYGMRGYREEVGVNNLITVKNHDIEKVNSPERLSLDQRIELELGVPVANSQTHTDQYQISSECPPFQDMNSSHFHGPYNCDNSSVGNDSFYQNQNVQMGPDFNGQYFNGHQQPPPTYGPYEQYPNTQPVTNSVMQVGNIVEVVPSLQHPPPSNAPQIMQVGNVLQVVPSQKTPGSTYGPSEIPSIVKTQKATAVVAPSSIVPTPNPEAVLNPLIKAIQLEREKRRKEKEKRRAEREARRKARQLKREAKLMSVNEKLKKSVQNEGLMLGQEVEDDELLDGLDVPSPPIPVEIITVSSPSALPPAGKGILITAGFMPKPPSEKKEVKFADGVCPGEGTSESGGEEIASPPPKPKLPKEKRFKKKKTKVKKKVKVQIIRQIIQEEEEDDDDLSPPPPPPGSPPPVFFARFPFAGDVQFPVYQTQTTTTTLTTVQYPATTFE